MCICADNPLQGNAALTMIERSANSWGHNQFKDCSHCKRRDVGSTNVIRCSNLTLSTISYYKALSFYLQEQPTLLTDLLLVLIPRIDHSRVMHMFRQVDHIPLICSYLCCIYVDPVPTTAVQLV
jgi:clathrin heavy chain